MSLPSLVTLVCANVLVRAVMAMEPALQSWGNRSEPLQSLLSLVERQTCTYPYGTCDTGQCCLGTEQCCGTGCTAIANSCCFGYECPPNNNCCGTDGYCVAPGWGCCGTNGHTYPLDGSECCFDDSYCPAGSYCVRCDYDSSQACCQGSEDQSPATYPSDNPVSVTAPPASSTTSDSYYYTTTTSYDSSTYYIPNYSYYYYTLTYWYYTFYYTFYISTTEVFSSTIYETTTLSAYATSPADASRSIAAMTESIEYYATSSANAERSRLSVALPTSSSAYTTAGLTGTGGGGDYSSAPGIAAGNHFIVDALLMAVATLVGMLAVIL